MTHIGHSALYVYGKYKDHTIPTVIFIKMYSTASEPVFYKNLSKFLSFPCYFRYAFLMLLIRKQFKFVEMNLFNIM